MTANPRQLDLLGKADRLSIALGEAVKMPDWQHLGICETVGRMNEELKTLLMCLREEIERPKAVKSNTVRVLRGGGPQ